MGRAIEKIAEEIRSLGAGENVELLRSRLGR